MPDERPAAVDASRLAFRGGAAVRGRRTIPEEVPVAIVYDGSTQAVMMASPADLEDFAVGFSLTEGIVGTAAEIERLELLAEAEGIELRMRLAAGRGRALAARRRHLAGPTGCGLCGIESLEEALRPVPRVGRGAAVAPAAILAALAALAPAQALNRATHAVHAAAFWRPGEGLLAIREDVGRHNALDKLAGALARAEIAAADGILLITSRVSVEMVQKAAMLGVPLMVAVSAPTALAIRTAEAAGITLVAIARGDGFEVFSHPDRIFQEARADVG